MDMCPTALLCLCVLAHALVSRVPNHRFVASAAAVIFVLAVVLVLFVLFYTLRTLVV